MTKSEQVTYSLRVTGYRIINVIFIYTLRVCIGTRVLFILSLSVSFYLFLIVYLSLSLPLFLSLCFSILFHPLPSLPVLFRRLYFDFVLSICKFGRLFWTFIYYGPGAAKRTSVCCAPRGTRSQF